MQKHVSAAVMVALFAMMMPLAAAQVSPNPTIFLSSNEVSFFNGDQDHVDVTVKNNDDETHTFTISVFPNSLDNVFATSSINHVTLAPQESGTFRLTFSSTFEAEFVPRQFSVSASATDDASLTSTKDVFVTILRRSPVFVLSLSTNKFAYQPGDTMNVSSVIANQGADSLEEYLMQTTISKGGETLKRFESTISYLPERSSTTFSNIYTFEQFTDPGTYTAQIVLKDASGGVVSSKSINFRVGQIDKASQEESTSFDFIDVTTVLSSRNEGNAPADMTITTVVPPIARNLFVSDVGPSSTEDLGNSMRVSWVFEDVAPGQTVQVVTKVEVWKIWVIILVIAGIVYFVFRFVLTVRITKSSRYFKNMTRDSEIPVTIEVVNRSIGEVKDLIVRDFVPPIAKIVPKFETVRPTTREAIGGTEVLWKFDSLRPGEERVMTYKIKPKMDILGSLRLNPTVLTYTDSKRKKKSAASGMVVIRPTGFA